MTALMPPRLHDALLRDLCAPARLGRPEEFAKLVRRGAARRRTTRRPPRRPPRLRAALRDAGGPPYLPRQVWSVVDNDYLNGCVIRLDAGARLSKL